MEHGTKLATDLVAKACQLCGCASLMHPQDDHCSLCAGILARLGTAIRTGEVR